MVMAAVSAPVVPEILRARPCRPKTPHLQDSRTKSVRLPSRPSVDRRPHGRWFGGLLARQVRPRVTKSCVLPDLDRHTPPVGFHLEAIFSNFLGGAHDIVRGAVGERGFGDLRLATGRPAQWRSFARSSSRSLLQIVVQHASMPVRGPVLMGSRAFAALEESSGRFLLLLDLVAAPWIEGLHFGELVVGQIRKVADEVDELPAAAVLRGGRPGPTLASR